MRWRGARRLRRMRCIEAKRRPRRRRRPDARDPSPCLRRRTARRARRPPRCPHQRPGAATTCRATWSSCRADAGRRLPAASASATRGPARCWRSATPATRGCRRWAADIDVRTDVPRYRVWRHGELVDEPTDIARAVARRPGVLRARLLVLVRGGAAQRRHRRCATSSSGCNVPMYRTNIADRSRPAASPARWWCRCGR